MYLIDHFLIALPQVEGNIFERSVVLVHEHSAKGAAGFIINKPSDVLFYQLFERVDLVLSHESLRDKPVLQGGPISMECGFVLSKAQKPLEFKVPKAEANGAQIPGYGPTAEKFYAATQILPGGLALTSSRDILEAFANGGGAEKALLFLGCAGWEAGQLEREIVRGDWLACRANHELLFSTPMEERYTAALALLGTNEVALSTAGKA